MKAFILFAGTAIALVGAFAPAQAKQHLRKNETYCLETRVGGDRGGGTIIECNYETMAQCYASKAGQGDTCMLNPVLAFAQRDRYYRTQGHY